MFGQTDKRIDGHNYCSILTLCASLIYLDSLAVYYLSISMIGLSAYGKIVIHIAFVKQLELANEYASKYHSWTDITTTNMSVLIEHVHKI